VAPAPVLGPSVGLKSHLGVARSALSLIRHLATPVLPKTMKESPIFVRTYDLLRWLIPATLKFPRQHRFVLAETVQRTALRFQEEIIEAGHRERPLAELARADLTLAKLKLYLRLCHDLDLFSHGQYEHTARLVGEVGRLLGAWRKTFEQPGRAKG